MRIQNGKNVKVFQNHCQSFKLMMKKKKKKKKFFAKPSAKATNFVSHRLPKATTRCSFKAVSGRHLLPWAPADFCRARALPCSLVNTCNLSCKTLFSETFARIRSFLSRPTITRGTSWSTNEQRFTRHTPKGWFLPTYARLLYTKHERESIVFVHVPVRRINLVIAA